MKVKEAEIQTEISKFKAEKDIEFTKARDKIVNEKKDQWQKEITELRKLMNKKCANSKTMNTPNKVVTRVTTKAAKKPLNTNKV
jgi:organic hydroperoxide reductase OsmC/OhrA